MPALSLHGIELASEWRRVMLRGRGQQCRALDGLLADVRAGRSRALVVRGEPGIGKTALLGYAAETAQDFQVARAVGVESEMELPFAALHQLCGRMLSRLGALPGPQRDALGWRSACVRAARRIVSWSAWRCWGCCRRRPPGSHCCAWSMMRSGWTRPRPGRWRSWAAGWTPNRSPWYSAPVTAPPAVTWPAC